MKISIEELKILCNAIVEDPIEHSSGDYGDFSSCWFCGNEVKEYVKALDFVHDEYCAYPIAKRILESLKPIIIGEITEKQFEENTEFKPQNDDLERVNCDKAGELLHLSCGWCAIHNQPMFICNCRINNKIKPKVIE